MRSLSRAGWALVPSLFVAASARAELELPQPSPLARVMQTVGLTEIEVEYSSPAARGRTVWGGLVPYNQHWRTGANVNTIIRFSRDVKIGGVDVPAGAYSLHTVPGKVAWTLIVNRKTDGTGSGSYDESQDVLRTKVQVKEGPKRERLSFVFSDTTASGTNLDLEWAGVQVRLPIEVHTEKQVDAVISASMKGLWREPAMAARYLVDAGRDLDQALELADRSINIQQTWYNTWIKARVLGDKGEIGDARLLTERALELGDDSGAFSFYAQQMKTALKTWSSK